MRSLSKRRERHALPDDLLISHGASERRRCTTAVATMVITAVMPHRKRKLVQAFEQAGAISVAQARTTEELGLQLGMAWHRLVAHAVLRCPAEGSLFSGCCELEVPASPSASAGIQRRSADSSGADLGDQPASLALILPETTAMSARPAAFSFTAATTLPMSRGELAPVSLIAASTRASISASLSLVGK
jgi:hypothetical protein